MTSHWEKMEILNIQDGQVALNPGGGGGGGTLIFSHIRRLGLYLGFIILNFNIFGGFQKNEYFWGV